MVKQHKLWDQGNGMEIDFLVISKMVKDKDLGHIHFLMVEKTSVNIKMIKSGT